MLPLNKSANGWMPSSRTNSVILHNTSPIFLEPLILRERRSRKIKGSRKISENVVINL